MQKPVSNNESFKLSSGDSGSAPNWQVVVTYHDIDGLKPDPKNPRIHGRKQRRLMKKLLILYGWVLPLLIDKNNVLVAGQLRWEIAKELGHTKVPVVLLDHLSEREIQALRIADNQIAALGEWDEQALGLQLKDLSLDINFDMDLTGFEGPEVDSWIEGLNTLVVGDDFEDVVPETAAVPVSMAGDLWNLRDHKIYAGNALDEASFATVMAGEKAAMVFIDPPFNVKIGGNVSGLGKVKHREFAMATGEMTEVEFIDFLVSALRLLVANSADGSLHYIVIDWRHVHELSTAGRATYTELKNLCVWVKNNGGMGSFYRSRHELIFVFKSGRGRHRNNVELGKHGRNRTNVWEYSGANTLGRQGDEGNLLALHPTVKPVRLVADAMLDCTARGDIVLDSFLGSGTTLIAAERTGRRCFGMELDPLYVDTAIRRWQAYTREDAVHAMTGRTFSDIAAEQEAERDR